MLTSEVANASKHLAARAMIRAEAVEAWVSLAREQGDPVSWTNDLIAAALDRLSLEPQAFEVKAEARLQIMGIRRSILSALARSA